MVRNQSIGDDNDRAESLPPVGPVLTPGSSRVFPVVTLGGKSSLCRRTLGSVTERQQGKEGPRLADGSP